jgi:hypothetical protein
MNALENFACERSVEVTRWLEGSPRKLEIKRVFLNAIESAKFERTDYVKLEFGLFDHSRAGGIIRLWRKRADGHVAF